MPTSKNICFGFLRRLRGICFGGLALCTTLTVLPLSAGANPKSFEIDIYVTSTPVEGESFEAINLPNGAVQIPISAFGADGTVVLDAKFEGAEDLRKAIYTAFSKANEKFAAADVQFHIRTIKIISAVKSPLKAHFGKDSDSFDIAEKDGKSGLLEKFRTATRSTKDAFRFLLAPIDGDQEVGKSDNGGSVGIVDIAAALMPAMNGFGIVHELTHNLGVAGHHGDSMHEAMGSSVPDPQRGQTADPALTEADIRTIKARVATGFFNALVTPPANTAGESKSSSSAAKTASKPKTTKKAASQPPAAARNQPSSALPAAIGFGIGVGIGTGLMNSGRSGGHHHNQ